MQYKPLFSNHELKAIREWNEKILIESDIPEPFKNRIRTDFENALQIANEKLTEKLNDTECSVSEAYVLAKHAFCDHFKSEITEK